MEKQEIFTQVVKHLFKQGYKSEGWLDPDADGTGCLYRAEDGGRCAVGYFIPDDVYSVCMEGKSVSSLWDTWQDELPAWMGDNIELLTDLQNVHDGTEVQYDGKLFVMDELRRGLLRVMGKYQLEWPVVYSNLDALDALQERLNLAHEAATNSQ
jgi:hypothetical protein